MVCEVCLMVLQALVVGGVHDGVCEFSLSNEIETV